MKHSAWYHKLWAAKLNSLPLKEDADSAWAEMEQILDKQLPVNSSGTPSSGLNVAKIATYLSYVAAAAAVLGITAYLVLQKPEPVEKVKQQQEKNLLNDSIIADSVERDTSSINSVLIETLAPIKRPGDIISRVRPITIKATKMYESFTHTNHSADTKNSLSQLLDDNGVLIASSKKTESIVNNITKKQASSSIEWLDSISGIHSDEKRKQKHEIYTPTLNYGLEIGINQYSKTNNIFVTAYGSYAFSPRWLLHTGLTINTPRTFKGHYTRESYFKPDSLPAFQFTDSRKTMALDIPLRITYKISNQLSINAGPVFSFPLKQTEIKLGPIKLTTDTLRHTKVVYDILNNTRLNRINYGFSTGISAHLSQFDINARYQMLSPYNFRNEFGTNRFNNCSFQFSIGYRFK